MSSITVQETLKEENPTPSYSSATASFSPASSTLLVHPRSPLLAAGAAHADEIETKTPPLEQLLQHVAFGEESEAEVMLRACPELAMDKGDLVDPSIREFKQITGFQYAVWSLDWRMWRMFMRYMDKQEIAAQLMEIDQYGTAHGKCFSLQPLLGTFENYLNQYGFDNSSTGIDWEALAADWNEKIGRGQLLLPAHIVQEYCHPSRNFLPCPDFKEEVRSESLMTQTGNWYQALRDGVCNGTPFAYLRSHLKQAQAVGVLLKESPTFKFNDCLALEELSKRCNQQHKNLIATQLCYSPALAVHFPAPLTEIILSYLSSEADKDADNSNDDVAASALKM